MPDGKAYIVDEVHCDLDGPFESFDAAVAELRRRAEIAWDVPPNQPPCTSWRTCRREYHVREYDATGDALLRKTHVLDVSAGGVIWAEGLGPARAASGA